MNLEEATIKALQGKLLMEGISEINIDEIFNNVKEIIKSNFDKEDGEISEETENEISLEYIDSYGRGILTKKVKKYLLSLGMRSVTEKGPNTRMYCNGYYMTNLYDGYSRTSFFYKDKLVITLTSYNDGNYEVEKKLNKEELKMNLEEATMKSLQGKLEEVDWDTIAEEYKLNKTEIIDWFKQCNLRPNINKYRND